MSIELQDRVVVVTGGGSGIGRATAHLVADRGGVAVIADINGDAARAVEAEIGAADGQALAVDLDVASRDSWAQAIGQVVERFGRLDGLVNNAGLTRDRSLLKMSDDEWRSAVDVNLTGTWLGCQHAIPVMKENGGGSIVNLSSESRHGAFGQVNYAAAKAGVVGLTRTVALEHARHGIRCNAVAPGTILTPMVLAVPEDIRESWLPGIPLRRVGDPEEVAKAIAFLVGDDSSYITGQVLNVDGGSSW